MTYEELAVDCLVAGRDAKLTQVAFLIELVVDEAVLAAMVPSPVLVGYVPCVDLVDRRCCRLWGLEASIGE